MSREYPKIGWASRDMTPTRPALLQGQKYVRIARTAADPLTVTACAVEGGGSNASLILISCDLPNISEALMIAVRERVVSAIPALPPEAIMMNATHTHTAFVITAGSYPQPEGDVMTAAEGLELVVERAAEAGIAAWEDRCTRQMGRAFGHAVVGHNRRAVYASGIAQMYGKTNDPAFSHVEGYEDHSLDMIFVWDPDGSLSGIILNIPCPSQVSEHTHEFSADYWHDVRVELRQRLGTALQVLPQCGAAGDQSPHFLLYEEQEAEMRQRRGVTERQEIASRVADAVERALACTEPEPGETTIAHTCRRVPLSPRSITQEERDWAAEAAAQSIKDGECQDLWWPQMLGDVVARFDRGEPMPAFEAELHGVRLGDAVIVSNPFELYLDYGLQIKARSTAKQTLVMQLSCNKGIYLPSKRAVEGGHYGAHPVVAPVGPEGGKDLVEASLEMIHQLWAAGEEG
jgi:hypothetical protein